jgi:hypothetical protein
MSTHTGNWFPVGPILTDADGKPYQMTSDGHKNYLPPRAIDPYGPGAPKGMEWNSETGQYEKQSHVLDHLVMGAALAPFAAFAAPALFGGGGGGAGAAATSSNTGASIGTLGVPDSLAAVGGTGEAAGAGSAAAGTAAATGAGVVTKKLGSTLGDKLLDLGLNTGAGLLQGYGESLLNPQQRRQSFAGGPNDPNRLASDISGQIASLRSRIASQSVPEIPMPDFSAPTFTGGGMPMPIGLLNRGMPGIQRRASTAPVNHPQDLQQMMAALGMLKGGAG